MATGIQVVIDCTDPARLAPFWATALGYKIQDPPAGFATWQDFLVAHGVPESEWNSASAIVDPDARGPRIFFQRVPEAKTSKNRLHLDVNVGGREQVDAEVLRLQQAGATRLRDVEPRGEYWVVMHDPDGSE